MKAIVLYSSVTGNTRSVAEAIHGIMPGNTPIFPVHKAPPPDEYELLILGFWVRRAKPDPRMLRYMGMVQNKRVAWFGTLAAWPDSPHAGQVRANAELLLRGNQVLGGFLCQGRLEAKRFAACMNGTGNNASHPMTEERRMRLIEASKHPDAADFAAAREYFKTLMDIQ